MKILVTGANGLLGSAVTEEILRRGQTCIATGRAPQPRCADATVYAQADLCDPQAVQALITDTQPDAVIHCAAWTDVDGGDPEAVAARAAAIAEDCLPHGVDVHRRDRRIDRVITGRWTALPVMLALLGLVFWLTLWGANAPSSLLSRALMSLQEPLRRLLSFAPWWVQGAVVDGVYRTAAAVPSGPGSGPRPPP